jgi:UDP-glucose 4-epimerase
MKERVLITGASGFVGYHLIIEALKNDLEVCAAVRKDSKIDHLKGLAIQFTYPDFTNIPSLISEIKQNRYDYIIHAAGVTSARSQKEYDDINASYTHNLAEAVKQSGIDLKRFVLISSLAAIGPLNNLDGIITEDTIPHPITSYGKSKLQAEEKLKAFSSLNYNILRPTGVYGPRDRGIYIFFKQIARGIEPYIGKTPQQFSFIYVIDVAQAAIKALYSGNHQTFNLSDGYLYNRYELAKTIKEALNRKTIKLHLPVNFVKIIAHVAEKYGALANKAVILNVEKLTELTATNWYCDITRAKAGLGFEPQYNLRSGVTETLKWYKSNNWL